LGKWELPLSLFGKNYKPAIWEKSANFNFNFNFNLILFKPSEHLINDRGLLTSFSAATVTVVFDRKNAAAEAAKSQYNPQPPASQNWVSSTGTALLYHRHSIPYQPKFLVQHTIPAVAAAEMTLTADNLSTLTTPVPVGIAVGYNNNVTQTNNFFPQQQSFESSQGRAVPAAAAAAAAAATAAAAAAGETIMSDQASQQQTAADRSDTTGNRRKFKVSNR
jgi:hypothetical protein